MTATRDFWLHIGGERAAAFEQVFGTRIVAVESPATHMALLPGLDEPQEVYLLDLEWAREQGCRQRIVAHLSCQFGVEESFTDARLEQEGLPLLAADTTLEIRNPQKWFN